MFPGHDYGRLHVSSAGELVVRGARRGDSGFYVCSALSVAGSKIAKAYLEVTSVDDYPPPLIQIGPSNQTLTLKSKAVLPCSAVGEPEPKLRWSKDGVVLKLDKTGRVSITERGTLIVDGKFIFYSLGREFFFIIKNKFSSLKMRLEKNYLRNFIVEL